MPRDEWRRANQRARYGPSNGSRPKARQQRRLTTMLFGKYKGVRLDQVPFDYLVWLQDNVGMKPALSLAVCLELKRRRSNGSKQGKAPLE